jgi:hypothetical protein
MVNGKWQWQMSSAYRILMPRFGVQSLIHHFIRIGAPAFPDPQGQIAAVNMSLDAQMPGKIGSRKPFLLLVNCGIN